MAKKVQTIKDFYYRVLGYIETYDDGSKIARDFSRRILGRYDPKRDNTKDFYGRIIGRGDLTGMLFNRKDK